MPRNLGITQENQLFSVSKNCNFSKCHLGYSPISSDSSSCRCWVIHKAAKSRLTLQDLADWLTATQLSPAELESYGLTLLLGVRPTRRRAGPHTKGACPPFAWKVRWSHKVSVVYAYPMLWCRFAYLLLIRILKYFKDNRVSRLNLPNFQLSHAFSFFLSGNRISIQWFCMLPSGFCQDLPFLGMGTLSRLFRRRATRTTR